ncbi:MAG: hypothetical protein Fur0044_31680 [Anaerolineae bacterium]|nr:MAG: hypothetical protein EDM72_15955 [Chlorobiota bacterium]MBE7468860.1 hypothetical protein [Anaerolineales bacterium]MCQ3973254.1 hypothetical protein [Anaerolineae bacterium]
MVELDFLNIPAASIFLTGGLSSARQLVDTTSNEIFSFGDSTSELMIIPIFYPSSEQTEQAKDDQSWYWSDYWQQMEREAEQNLVDGDYEDFDNLDDFITSL